MNLIKARNILGSENGKLGGGFVNFTQVGLGFGLRRSYILNKQIIASLLRLVTATFAVKPLEFHFHDLFDPRCVFVVFSRLGSF